MAIINASRPANIFRLCRRSLNPSTTCKFNPVKLKHLITSACAVLASLIFAAPAARATLPYNNGDLILGFRATGGTGATTNYEINLGNATLYTTASGTVTPTLGNLKADLDTIYGQGATGWSTRGDVLWSVSGVVQPAANGFINNTM